MANPIGFSGRNLFLKRLPFGVWLAVRKGAINCPRQHGHWTLNIASYSFDVGVYHG